MVASTSHERRVDDFMETGMQKARTLIDRPFETVKKEKTALKGNNAPCKKNVRQVTRNDLLQRIVQWLQRRAVFTVVPLLLLPRIRRLRSETRSRVRGRQKM